MLGTSRGEANTDELTGLGNRRRLAEDLANELRDVTPERPLLLMLFDLNGFKAYNDTYGHPAGDALLARLGEALAGAVDADGGAYRMGGDEFCVLATAPPARHDEIAAASRAALSERGEGFHITAALGSAVLDRPGSDPADALRVADRRMYAEKNGRRASAGGQSTAVLLRVLTERNPDLGEHVDGVALLAEQIAAALGMGDEQRTAVRQAAVLHDIGKAAVPDAILDKPGPLDDDEWAFMRRHTIIGERIMQAAPALSAAAPLVRSSHEKLRRHRLSRRARPRGDPARRSHHRGLRRLRRHDLRPRLPAGAVARRRGGRAAPLRGDPVRSSGRAGVHRHARLARPRRRSRARSVPEHGDGAVRAARPARATDAVDGVVGRAVERPPAGARRRS